MWTNENRAVANLKSHSTAQALSVFTYCWTKVVLRIRVNQEQTLWNFWLPLGHTEEVSEISVV